MVQDNKWETSLHCGSESGFTDKLECLLDFIPPEKLHKALMITDLKGRTPVWHAVEKDSTDIAKCMLDCVPGERRYTLI